MSLSTNKSELTLYVYPNYRSMRCVWLATELGIKSDIRIIQMDPSDSDKGKCESYRSTVHPHCTIPALVLEDEKTIIESGAICLYLADLHKRFSPGAQWTAEYYNWVVYACSTLDDMMEHIFVQWCLTHPENQDENLVKRMAYKFRDFANYFNKYMEGKSYICGDTFTAADCVIGYNIWWASTMKEGCLINDHPEIVRYLGTLQRRDAFQQTFLS
ncbi:uncharacterized protein LOC132547442 [Ylistrum balloti]|uniref:uncharacterized protein LOC132547442 n=1 Tax=Ylistrum balloti TaxID=509963 RepID=UPI002905B79A|nr:uncharacterized protein LOC132547442 [Ylistrum balloti]